MNVQILVRGRYVELEGVRIRKDGSNAWNLTIPVDDRVCRQVRRGPGLEDWDGAVFVLDDRETAPCVATGEARGTVSVSVWILPNPSRA